jgi:hAT family C-terminal dimerisation region
MLSFLCLTNRVKSVLSVNEKEAAKAHLLSLWDRMNPETCNTTASHSANIPEEADDLELYLRATESSNDSRSMEGQVHRMGIIRILDAFDAERRLEKDRDILDYWESQKLNKPELFSLAQIALSFPVTQVSVERAFSSLKYVLSPYRQNLKPDIVEDILVIRGFLLIK